MLDDYFNGLVHSNHKMSTKNVHKTITYLGQLPLKVQLQGSVTWKLNPLKVTYWNYGKKSEVCVSNGKLFNFVGKYFFEKSVFSWIFIVCLFLFHLFFMECFISLLFLDIVKKNYQTKFLNLLFHFQMVRSFILYM